MTLVERIAGVLKRARVAGGWDDEEVGAAILAELGLNEDGNLVVLGGEPPDAESE